MDAWYGWARDALRYGPTHGGEPSYCLFRYESFEKIQAPRFAKLLAKMNIDQRYLSEDDIGFMLTPRLNAASRMDDSDAGLWTSGRRMTKKKLAHWRTTYLK